jgi:S-(hydroxymethyl)glutathione dehydrogenase/alcohol dehydrogenase
MRIQAAVLDGVGRDWKIEEIALDRPKAGEVMVPPGMLRSEQH